MTWFRNFRSSVHDIYSCDLLQQAITALYAKILIILGLSLPLTDALSVNISVEFSQYFYIFLFTGSLSYICFVYFQLFTKKFYARLIRRKQGHSTTHEDFLLHETRHHRNGVHHGRIYLKVGTIIFGIGSVIYTGIEIGVHWEYLLGCVNNIVVIRATLQMLFVFFQMYFIFQNQKIDFCAHRFLSRLGLMHLISTNICVWLNVLIIETRHDLEHRGPGHQPAHQARQHMGEEWWNYAMVTGDEDLIIINNTFNNVQLHTQQALHQLLESISPFLFPCTIEYSLICAAILYIMWKQVSREERVLRRTKRHVHRETPDWLRLSSRYSLDCSKASTGLFWGILVLTVTIISLILFFVFISDEDVNLRCLAAKMAAFSEFTIYSVTSLAAMVAMCQMRRLEYVRSESLELDNLLLIIAQTGVFIFAVFSIIGTLFQLEYHLVEFLASVLTLVQASFQTIFILDASCRFVSSRSQVETKPGRQMVTFLMVTNIAMWLLNTLETSRTDSHPTQNEFYGGEWVWPLISHIAMPLAIFYRFHSSVCLFEIWKKSFKLTEMQHNIIS